MSNILIQCLGKKDAAPALAICMAKGFAADSRNKVYCLLSDQISNKCEWIADDRLDVCFIKTGNKRNFIRSSIGLLFNTRRKLKKYYKNIPFVLSIQPFVHPWGGIINSTIQVKHKMGICHDPNPHTGETCINKLFSYLGYRSTNELIVLTKKYMELVKDKFKKPVFYMKLGLFSNYRMDDVHAVSVNEKEGNINFLFFGRIEKYKGIDILLEAYAKICNESTTLTIAGDGDFSEYKDITENCSNMKLYNRYIQDEEVGQLFSTKNTVLVVPYIDATQSGVIPIAVDYLVPIIASDTGGLREQLDDGRIGLFVKPRDVEQLSEIMKTFVTDPSMMCLQKKNMEKYKPQLEWKNITKKLLEDIENI